jgi:hypothetical protein
MTGGNPAGNWWEVARFVDASANKGISLGYDGSAQTSLIVAHGTASTNLAFWTYNGSAWDERMRLSAAGLLGIGQNNPQFLVDAYQTANDATMRVTSANAGAWFTTNNNAAYGGTVMQNGGVDKWVAGMNGADTYVIQRGRSGSVFTTVDTNGNMGIGVTPGGGYKLEVAGAINVVPSSTTGPQIGIRLHDVGGGAGEGLILQWESANRPDMARIRAVGETNGGGLVFSTNAANTGTSSDRMYIDADGSVGINAANGGAQFGNTGKFAVQTVSSTNGIVATFANSGSTGAGIQFFQNGVDTAGIGMPPGDGGMAFYTGSNSEKMRLTSDGKLLVGTTTDIGTKLQVVDSFAISNTGGAQFFLMGNRDSGGTNQPVVTISANAVLQWGHGSSWTSSTGGTFTESMRLNTTNGYLTLGTTTEGVTNANSFSVLAGLGNIAVNHVNGTASGTAYQYFAYNGSAIGTITQNGTAAVLYNTTSDERLKKNIMPALSASDLIDEIQVREFDFKTGDHVSHGFVAQELHKIVPDAVHVGGENPETDPWGVDPSKLVALLLKEVQELRARVALLEAR